MSTRTVRVPWEGTLCVPSQVEFRSRLIESGSAGAPREYGARLQGRPSFGYLSWPRKKGNQPPGCPRPNKKSCENEHITVRLIPVLFPVVGIFVFHDFLVFYVALRRRIELHEVAGLQVEIEGSAVLVDFVKHDVIRSAFLDQDVEAITTGLVGERLVGVFLDQLQKGLERAGMQIKFNGNDVAGHGIPGS